MLYSLFVVFVLYPPDDDDNGCDELKICCDAKVPDFLLSEEAVLLIDDNGVGENPDDWLVL